MDGLVQAIKQKDQTNFEFLLGQIKDVNEQDEKGKTYIFHAIACNNIPAVKLLLSRGANYEIKDAKGFLPTDCMYDEEWGIRGYVDLELKTKYQSIYKLLVADLSGVIIHNRERLFNEALSSSSFNAKSVINDGVWDVHIRLKDGSTPMHLAAKKGRTKVVVALLSTEQNIENLQMRKGKPLAFSFVDSQDEKGNTALHYAVQNVHTDVVELLVQAGASTGIRNNKSETPMDLVLDSTGKTALEQSKTTTLNSESDTEHLSPIEKMEKKLQNNLIQVLIQEYKYGVTQRFENAILQCNYGEEAGCYGLYVNSMTIKKYPESQLEEVCRYSSLIYEGASHVEDIICEDFDVCEINELIGEWFDWDENEDGNDITATHYLLQRICLQLENDGEPFKAIPLGDQWQLHIAVGEYVDFEMREKAKTHFQLPLVEYLKTMVEK